MSSTYYDKQLKANIECQSYKKKKELTLFKHHRLHWSLNEYMKCVGLYLYILNMNNINPNQLRCNFFIRVR